MNRREIWTVAAPGDYTSKPRPALIVQDDRFGNTHGITICLLTTDMPIAWSYRVEIDATEQNGLSQRSAVMIDRLTSVPRFRLGRLVGTIDDLDMRRVEDAVRSFLELD